MSPDRTDAHPARGASFIALLGGLWLFFSPWIYGAYGNAGAWNNWIVGMSIFVFAVVRFHYPAKTGFCWVNSILGIWTFLSPWVFGYARPGRLINSLIVGFIVFCAAIAGANSERMSHDKTSTA